MSEIRPAAKWPLFVTLWILTAVFGAIQNRTWSVVVCGVVAFVCVWGTWLCTPKANR